MSLFRNPPKVVIIIGIFVAAFAAGLIWNKAHSAPVDAPYVQLSGGSAVVRGYAPVLDLTFTEPAPQLHGAYWQESLTVIGSSTFNGQQAPNNFVARGLFVDGFGKFDIGLGLSWMQNPAPFNGSAVNFNLQLAYRLPLGATLTYTHLSNAGTKLPNYGRDIVLVGWRFR